MAVAVDILVAGAHGAGAAARPFHHCVAVARPQP